MKLRKRLLNTGRWITTWLLMGTGLVLAGTTAFFYQGRLIDGTEPATGLYDLRFQVFNALTGGAPVSIVITNEDVPVINGLFNIALDFGPGPFTGESRWLEIGVRPGSQTMEFTNLMPRQPLLSAPYAIYASSAQTSAVAGQVNWANMVGVPPYLPGPGLVFGASNEFVVNFAGSGVSNRVARSDHDHLGQTWSADTNLGLKVVSTLNRGANVALWGESASTNGLGVVGVASATKGTNIAVLGRTVSSQGVGVLGEATHTNGVGVQARGGGPGGTALALANGGIRVTGAGLGTLTPVFIHRVTATNVVYGNQVSVINHPLCNGDSNAILIVTQNLNPRDPTGTNTPPLNLISYPSFPVLYTGTNPNYAPYANRWAIFNASGFITNVPINPAFNVLVVKP